LWWVWRLPPFPMFLPFRGRVLQAVDKGPGPPSQTLLAVKCDWFLTTSAPFFSPPQVGKPPIAAFSRAPSLREQVLVRRHFRSFSAWFWCFTAPPRPEALSSVAVFPPAILSSFVLSYVVSRSSLLTLVRYGPFGYSSRRFSFPIAPSIHRETHS